MYSYGDAYIQADTYEWLHIDTLSIFSLSIFVSISPKSVSFSYSLSLSLSLPFFLSYSSIPSPPSLSESFSSYPPTPSPRSIPILHRFFLFCLRLILAALKYLIGKQIKSSGTQLTLISTFRTYINVHIYIIA